jgi:hypothetical protein
MTGTVHQALAAVMAELPNIGKADKSPEGYAYRGIEAVTRHLQPLLARHGVVIVPDANIIATVPSPAMKDGWQDVIMHVDWTIIGPDGSTVKASTNGVGRDRSDKGANKAQTQAFKYLVLHLFCIADGKDDSDQQSYDQDRRPESMPAKAAKRRLLAAAGGDKEAAASVWEKAGLADRDRVTEDEFAVALGELDALSWSWHRPDTEPDDTPPSPATKHWDPKSLAIRAGKVFQTAYDAAPRGDKTRAVERLRHAVAWAASNNRASSFNDLTDDELAGVWSRLEDISTGRVTYTADPLDPGAGVTFTDLRTCEERTVLWSEFEGEVSRPALGRDGTGPGGATDREAVDTTNKPATAGRADVDTPPGHGNQEK